MFGNKYMFILLYVHRFYSYFSLISCSIYLFLLVWYEWSHFTPFFVSEQKASPHIKETYIHLFVHLRRQFTNSFKLTLPSELPAVPSSQSSNNSWTLSGLRLMHWRHEDTSSMSRIPLNSSFVRLLSPYHPMVSRPPPL